VPIVGAIADTYTDYMTGDVATSGDVVVVGLPLPSPKEPPIRAAAAVFRFDGTKFAFEAELAPGSSADLTAQFGRFVEVSRSGDTAIVSDSLHAFVFRRENGTWSPGQKLGSDDASDLLAGVAVTDDRAVIGYYGSSVNELPGKAIVHRLEGTTWVVEHQVVDDRLNGSNGNPVTIDEDRFVVANRTGADLVFERSGTSWTERQELSGGAQADLAGNRLLFHGHDALAVYERDTDGTFVRCDSMACNDQCDGALLDDFIITGGAPAYAVGGVGRLMRFDGSEWVADWQPEHEARSVDIGARFAVLIQEGFVPAPLQVIQFAP
jgi:hypothetical protein